MKKTLLFVLFTILTIYPSYSQTSTDTFETESHSSPNLTDNGVVFNIISHSSVFDIQANYPGTGWNGTSIDNRYIDNSNSSGANASFSIKTTSNLFKVNRFWIFLSNSALNQNVTGTLMVTGKLSGVTKFTQTKSTGFATSLGSTNGYTFIDMTNLNGQNYSNIVIDELLITLGGNYTYAGLDAFTWVKDSGVVLGINDEEFKNTFKFYPNPAQSRVFVEANTLTNALLQIFDINGHELKSQKIDNTSSINIDDLQSGIYLFKISSQEGTATQRIVKN